MYVCMYESICNSPLLQLSNHELTPVGQTVKMCY